MHAGNPNSKKLVAADFNGDRVEEGEWRRKEGKLIEEIDVRALADFLAKLETAGLIHVNRRKLRRP